jgi:hypothetical protein
MQRKALAAAALVALVAACGGTAQPPASPSPVAAVGAIATPAPTASPTVRPTPTVAATATPAATPTPSSKPGCTVAIDVVPALGVKVNFTGEGFKPDFDLYVVMKNPKSSTKFNGPGPEWPHPFGLHTNAAGAFGPWDLTAFGKEEIGKHSVSMSDGDCKAKVEFEITK